MVTIQFLDFSILSCTHYLVVCNTIIFFEISNVRYLVELDIMLVDDIVKTGAQFLMLFKKNAIL